MCIFCDSLSTPLPQSTSEELDATEPLTGIETIRQPSPGEAGIGDSFYPGFGNGGYDAKHYTLDLNVIDVGTSTLNGITTIEAEATQDLIRFNLDFIGFTIDGITVNGNPAEFSRDGQELTIMPTEALYKSEPFTVEVKYNGSPAFPRQTGWRTYNGGSFVLGQPAGAASYYPVNDHPLDKASYTFLVTVPEPFEVAANGILEETTDNGDTTTYAFEARDPMASYLATVNIAAGFNLQTEEGPNGIPIRDYYADGIPENLLAPFALQAEMLGFFNDIFGPYPFEVYGSVVLNTATVAALETQTLSIFGVDRLGFTPVYIGGVGRFFSSTEEIVAHELAHQWFGDSVSLADWSDIWLNESFARYSQGLWLEYSQGTEVLEEWVNNKYNAVVDAREQLVSPGNPSPDNLFNNGVYDWGALGLHALRLSVGDDAFFDTLRTYYDRFKGGNVIPEDFIGVAEEVSGQELNAFFDSWFYSRDIPPIPELGLSSDPTGDETLEGTSAAEVIFGRDGNDTIFGNDGTDVLIGGAGDDLLYGGSQADNIMAGDGNDTIYANGGANFINSGAGNDTIWLSASAEIVVLNTGAGNDIINNFQLGATKLQVSSINNLSFADSADGAQIFQGEDLLAVVTLQSASVFSSNTSQIFG